MKNTTTLTLGAALLLSLSACSSLQRNTSTRGSSEATYATAGKGEEVLPPVAERTTTNQRWGQRFSAF